MTVAQAALAQKLRALQWLTDEVEFGLGQAHNDLCRFIEQPEDRSALESCGKVVHQLNGVLEVARIGGTKPLFDEMEALLTLMAKSPRTNVVECCEALAQSLNIIPAYLYRTMVGGEENPASLHSLIADIRALRGLPLFPSGGGLNPVPPGAAGAVDSGVAIQRDIADVTDLLKGLRRTFRAAFLGLLKGESRDEYTQTLEKTSARVRELCRGMPVEKLWWVAGAYFEALFYRAIALRPATRHLLRELDRELAALQRDPGKVMAGPVSDELLTTLLYYVAASASDTPRVNNVIDSFGLSDVVDKLALTTGFGARSFDTKLIRSVTAALLEEVRRLKEMLASHYRDPLDPGHMREARAACQRLVASLEVIARGDLRDHARELERQIREWTETRGREPSADMRGLAELVVELESAFVAWQSNTLGDHASVELPEELRVEINSACNALFAEMRSEVELIKGTLAEFFSTAGNRDRLAELPAVFDRLSGALRMMGLGAASDALAMCKNFVTGELLDPGAAQRPAARAALAEVLTSVEYYLEGVAWETMHTSEVAPLIPPGARELLGGATHADRPETTNSSIEVKTMSPSKSKQSGDKAAATGKSAKKKAIKNPDLDPEIQEIFVEEAGEVLGALAEAFPQWQSNLSDQEALAATRRAFHTLKGSGRMVGAEEIGELAWSVENMLNKVIDKRIMPGEAVLSVVAAAIELIPSMVADFGGADTGFNGDRERDLRETATRLANGEVAALGAAEEVRVPVDDEDAVDPALIEIFILEAQGHLDAVEEFVAGQRQSAPFFDIPTPGLQAALHTLKGSAHMAAIRPVATVITPLERFIKELLNFQVKLDEDTVDLLADCHKFSKLAVAWLEAGNAPDEEDEALLLARIGELRERLLGPILGQEEEVRAVDPSFLSLLMADGMEMVLEAEDTLEGWKSAGAVDTGQLDAMVADLHQLTQGAGRAGLPPMVDLGNQLIDAYDRLRTEPGFNAEQSRILVNAHEILLNMADAVAADQKIEPISRELAGTLAEITAVHSPEQQAEPRPDVQPAAVEVEDLETAGEADDEIVELFIGEGRELLESLEQALHSWSQTPGDRSFAETVKRDLHTFKGGARMAARGSLGNLIHDFESVVIDVEGKILAGDREQFAELLSWYDQVAAAFDAVQIEFHGAPAAAGEKAPDLVEPEFVPEPPQQWHTAEILPFTGTYRGLFPLDQESVADSQVAGEQIRIAADVLDHLVNLAGESSISRSQVEQNINEFIFSLDEMEATIGRLQDQVRRMAIETDAQVMFRREQIEAAESDEAFDPLEMDRYSQLQQLSRSLLESASDLHDLRDTLLDKSRDAEALLLQQSRINTDLQEGLMRTRMVSFTRIVPRLRRVVRQVGSSLGKQINLDLGSVEGELDRTVLERIISPLEHMIRNAIDHGIEATEQRRELGKDSTGTISISFAREGGDVLIRIADDGRGLDIEGIRDKAFAMGLINEHTNYSDNDIAQLIFHPGFSTSAEITQTSGRGVGMDVVDSEVRQLGGSVAMTTQKGAGTEFLVRLPFTVSVNRALMIELGEDSYALALNSIAGVARMSAGQLLHHYQNSSERFQYGGESYEVRYLGSLLSADLRPTLDTALGQLPLVLIQTDEANYAVQVDALIGSQEIVVKTLGTQFNQVPGLSGATVLGDGRVVVILDIQGLLREEMSAGAVVAPLEPEAEAAREEACEGPHVQTIMVVDDSVTVRKVTGRFLEREGFRVVAAKDGVDAMRALQDITPDLMLLDIEMPRMDGFEVTRLVRSTQRLKDLPIIMITSRTGEKHRERALSMGVNRYLGKPYQEEVLIREVYGLLTSEEAG